MSSDTEIELMKRDRGKPIKCFCERCKRDFWSYDRERPPRICRSCFMGKTTGVKLTDKSQSGGER